jgi:hypothetical protein
MSIDGYGYGYIQVDFKRIERYYRLPIKVLLHAIEHANNCYNNNTIKLHQTMSAVFCSILLPLFFTKM